MYHIYDLLRMGGGWKFSIFGPPPDGIEQDKNSLQEFNDWKDVLTKDSQKKLDSFLDAFTGQAKQYMRQQRLLSRIYVSNTGTILCFPANVYYHASIIPKRSNGSQRDLLIFHPLDGL